MKLGKILLALLGAIILALVILFLVFLTTMLQGCATTNKSKSLHKATVDSVSTTKIDSSTHKVIDSSKVTKANSITVKESDGSFERETVILFDTSLIKNTSTRADYFQPGIGAGKLIIGDVGTYSHPVKSITIKEKGLNKAKETKTEIKNDSSAHHELNNNDFTKTVKTDLNKTESDKTKTVKRSAGYSWLWWLLLLIPAYLVYRNWPKIKTYLKFV